MSLSTPLRRLAPRCLSHRPRIIAAHTQTRQASSKDGSTTENPVLEEFQRKNPQVATAAAAGTKGMDTTEMMKEQQKLLKPGDISSSSIFEDYQRPELQQQMEQRDTAAKRPREEQYDSDTRRVVLDPDPRSRERWERKKVMQAVRKGGRMTREQMIKRTEREHLSKSENMKTSVKKLGMLARQIAGKTLEDAMVQMRFSKKKAAIAVGKHLDRAKNEAIVMRGMGLGSVQESEADDAAETPERQPVLIRMKDGKKRVVTDPSKIYIEQAWVGRGPYGKLPDYRAKGRLNIMRTPFTSLSVVLKEETTLLREYKEREEKKRRKRLQKLWTHLPDRPIQGPRGQHYCW